MNSFLKKVFQKNQHKVLFRFPSGKTRTYGEIWKESGKKALEWDRSFDLEKRPLLLQRPNSEKWLIEALAGWQLGAQVIPLAKHENLFQRIKEIRPALVCANHLVQSIKKPSTLYYDSPLALFTSGSLSMGTHITFSEENILTNLNQIGQVVDSSIIGESDVSFSVLPWSHSYGLTCELLFLLSRGASLFLPDPKESIKKQLFWSRSTLLFSVPYFLEKSIQCPSWVKNSGMAPLLFGGRLRSVSVGGAPCDPLVIQEFQDIYNVRVYQGYGMTEASPMISLNTSSSSPIHSVGKPLPGVDIEIDKTTGEILVSGKNISPFLSKDRYVYRDNKKFLKTGDKGRLDSEGFLYIEDRLADYFKLTNGFFIHSSKIEQIYQNELQVDRTVCIQHPKSHHHCLLVVFSPKKIVFTLDKIKKIGKSKGLLDHEIPSQIIWISSDRLSEFSTQKFTIKKSAVIQFVQKELE